MTVTIVLLLCWAAMRIAGDAPVGRLLRRMMVEIPATVLIRLEPGHVALAIVATLLIVLHLHAGDGDPIRMVALLAPDVTLWVAGFEFGTVVEATTAIVATLAALRRAGVATVLARLSVRLPRLSGSGGTRARRKPHRDRRSPANDDEDGAGFAQTG